MRTYIIAIFTALALMTSGTQAQIRYNDISDFGYRENPNPDAGENPYTNYLSKNDCLDYYYNRTPKDTNHCIFSKITQTEYASTDSLFRKKKVMSKTTTTYNKMGETLCSVEIDSNGKVSDSTYNIYDKAGNVLKTVEYIRNDSGRRIQSQYTVNVYDPKEELIKDSTIGSGRNYHNHSIGFFDDEGGYSGPTVNYYTFDTAGNTIETRSYTYSEDDFTQLDDSSHSWSKYDGHHDLIYNLNIQNGDTSRSYYTYNDHYMEIFSADVNYGDSTYTTYTYDKKGTVTERNHYAFNKVTTSYTAKTDKDGNLVETEEEMSTADALSCPNNSVTVTVTDSGGHELSKVITKEKDGNPLITTTVHKYQFDHGRVLCDSVFILEKGFMYLEEKDGITLRNFDKGGNLIFYSSIGGSYDYGGSTKYTWKYNNMSKMTRETQYSSCIDNTPETETDYIYYADSVHIKEVKGITANSDAFYDTDGRILKSVAASNDFDETLGGVKIFTRTEYEYKK